MEKFFEVSSPSVHHQMLVGLEEKKLIRNHPEKDEFPKSNFQLKNTSWKSYAIIDRGKFKKH